MFNNLIALIVAILIVCVGMIWMVGGKSAALKFGFMMLRTVRRVVGSILTAIGRAIVSGGRSVSGTWQRGRGAWMYVLTVFRFLIGYPIIGAGYAAAWIGGVVSPKKQKQPKIPR